MKKLIIVLCLFLLVGCSFEKKEYPSIINVYRMFDSVRDEITDDDIIENVVDKLQDHVVVTEDEYQSHVDLINLNQRLDVIFTLYDITYLYSVDANGYGMISDNEEESVGFGLRNYVKYDDGVYNYIKEVYENKK